MFFYILQFADLILVISRRILISFTGIGLKSSLYKTI